MRTSTKRILSMALALCLCLQMLQTVVMKAEAATPGYTVSTAYKGSSYYSALCNVTLTGNQRTDIVNVALSQVGYREGSYSGDYGGADDGSYNNYTEYNYWYHNYVSSGMPVGGDSAPWCATFVSWCAEQANIPTSVLRRSTAAGHGASYFNVNFYSGSSTLASSSDNDSYFKGYNYTPQKGDLFFTRSWSHVGLVVGVSGNYVITVEGNTNNNGSSQGNGVYKLTWRKISDLYFGVPNYTDKQIKHTVDTSYGTNFTAYPKAKITAENIFDAYHNQIDSTSWIGTSDKCTIHEVYTDGCCKVTYPLDAGGTKTVYSKISLFNTHTHSYTGARVYETEHPHRISQRCVDYATCGGWIWTDEYYELKTCEQCWHADFDIGASSISVKVGESKTVSVTLGGCLPDSAVLHQSVSPDNDVVEVTLKNQQATFTGLKAGTTSFSLTVYSDSSKSHIIGTITIPVTVTSQTYTVSYNANGGTGAPSDQTKYHGTSLTLSTTKPTRTGYTFLGWSTSSTATSATYQPGDSFTDNSDTMLYAVWEKEPVVLVKIELVSLPTKTVYEIGESLDTTGLVLKVTYSDGSTQTITSGFTTSGFDSSTAGEKTVTVSYGGTSTSFKVTVEEVEEVDPNAAQIVVGSKTAACGNTVEIDVEIVNNPGFSVLNVAFIYNTEYLTLLEVENHLSTMTMTSGSTVVWDAVENYTGNGVLCTLKFEIAEDAPEGEYEIQVLFISASNDEFEELNMSGVSGTLEICNILYGDVNGDGKIASVDLAMLRKYLACVDPLTGTSSIAVKAGADCNGDGKITSVDLAMLRKYLASVDPITGESTVILGPR